MQNSIRNDGDGMSLIFRIPPESEESGAFSLRKSGHENFGKNKN